MTAKDITSFDFIRELLNDPSSPYQSGDSRIEFLNHLLTTAIESGHVGFWMDVISYDPGDNTPGHPTAGSATIKEAETDNHQNTNHLIDHTFLEKALKTVRNAKNTPDKGTGNWERNLTTIPYLHQQQRNTIILADLTNDASLIDATDAVAILEIQLFGGIKYA